MKKLSTIFVCAIFLLLFGRANFLCADDALEWSELPELPNQLGVAGPFVGVHNDALIVAGGANFPKPVWENSKQWVDEIHVLTQKDGQFVWHKRGKLPRRIAYGGAVSTPAGVVCLGGSDSEALFDDVFLLSWDGKVCQVSELPALPKPCAYGQATLIGSTVYLACGQLGADLGSATNHLWSLDLSQRSDAQQFTWNALPNLPGPTRAFNMVAAQHNGYHDCVYVVGGRRDNNGTTEFLRDVWEYTPSSESWRQRKDAPRELMAGTAIRFSQSHIYFPGAASGNNFGKADELKDDHPGFAKQAFFFHTITNTWVSAGEVPQTHVTTNAVMWNGDIVIASGEIRPRVRSPKVYRVRPVAQQNSFGLVNYIVLFGYLAAMVGVGLYFAKRNNNTDQFFRGGQSIPWWAAGCSIFATMLSSLTYTGVPSKSYAQDWVYCLGNLMIPLVAIIAVYVALPFFRRIDATSAYEYLEKRFNRAVRLFGSASFTLFHLFRMAVVMSLTGLALSVATPLTPTQSVLLIGVLSILYCTMGGIEAVIWTDTIQTFVLLGGAAVAIGVLVVGVDGGVSGFITTASASNKFNIANFHWDATSSQIAFWVIVLGGFAQNISSYTADQAVVQRYMTTSDMKLAARSIWTNAILTIPATMLFFGIGTALFAFYQSHPERLDPTITTDQVFPLFISREMPIGIAGLLVAGIFAAAQSTVSTSMNSTATSIVTDFLRPYNFFKTDKGYLNAARVLTCLLGIGGTALGLIFVDPEIKSLFDQFIKVIGLFMGVLGGLFVLGVLTRRANGPGALIGGVAGACVMFCLWKYSNINGYLYTASGITSCFIIGYVASLPFKTNTDGLSGLTIYDKATGE